MLYISNHKQSCTECCCTRDSKFSVSVVMLHSGRDHYGTVAKPGASRDESVSFVWTARGCGHQERGREALLLWILKVAFGLGFFWALPVRVPAAGNLLLSNPGPVVWARRQFYGSFQQCFAVITGIGWPGCKTRTHSAVSAKLPKFWSLQAYDEL